MGRGYEALSLQRLGEVGEGLCAIGRAGPLTQLHLGSKLPSFRNPLPQEREIGYSDSPAIRSA